MKRMVCAFDGSESWPVTPFLLDLVIHLRPGEGNIDHIVPRSRGGATSWENCVIAAREVNSRKANLTPEEAGLRLLSSPQAPREMPVTMLLKNVHGIPDWEPFLKRG